MQGKLGCVVTVGWVLAWGPCVGLELSQIYGVSVASWVTLDFDGDFLKGLGSFSSP